MNKKYRKVILFAVVPILLCFFTVSIVIATVSKTPQNIISYVLYQFEEEGQFTVELSKFGVKDKTIAKMYDVFPESLGNIGSSKKSLGITASFTRKSYNYLDIIPTKPTIPIKGKVRTLDVWVWCGNFNYNMHMYLKDYRGYVHDLPMGNLKFYGWRNLSVIVPVTIPQGEPYVPVTKGLRFVKFRIWADPKERVDRFHVFLDYFKVVTDVYRQKYDGDNIEKIIAKDILKSDQAIYGKGGDSSSSSTTK